MSLKELVNITNITFKCQSPHHHLLLLLHGKEFCSGSMQHSPSSAGDSASGTGTSWSPPPPSQFDWTAACQAWTQQQLHQCATHPMPPPPQGRTGFPPCHSHGSTLTSCHCACAQQHFPPLLQLYSSSPSGGSSPLSHPGQHLCH